ncbi:MAG TPA: hypothetical protein VG318_10255 [Actinomycetota bacterium]|nr:hypothetical protein [Actinomycetota bacterium]
MCRTAYARRTISIIMLGLALLAQAAGSGAPRAGATEVRLPWPVPADLVVDYERRQVLVSGGRETDSIHVFDFDGRPLQPITAPGGPHDLLIDGDVMYAALEGAARIAIVDLVTLEVTDVIDVTPHTNPRYLSKSGNTIYYSFGCGGPGPQGFASVDLITRVPVQHEPINRAQGQCAEHAVVPSDPATLLAWDEFGSQISRYDVSARQPVPDGESPGPLFFDSLVFSKDGSTFYAVAWNPQRPGFWASRRNLADFEQVAKFGGGGVGIAVTPDERHLAAGNVNGIHSADLYLYRTQGAKRISSTETSDDPSGGEVQVGPLGITPSADRVFALFGNAGERQSNLLFRVVWPQYGVAGGAGSQSVPAGGGGFHVWSSQRSGQRTETLVARKGGRVWRVNPAGTSGYAGGIDGTRLVYQVVRRQQSDLRLYDLARRRHVSTLPRLNTRAWEWRPTMSDGRVLFSRVDARRERVVLHTLRTGRERALIDLPTRSHQAVAGQVAGPYAVWSQCFRTCTVVRMDLRTGAKVKVPHPRGRLDYAPSVTQAGAVYFARSGVGCGTYVSLHRYAHGRVTEIDDLRLGQDVFSTYAIAGTDTVLYDRVICKHDAFDVFSIRDVPGESAPRVSP